MSTDYFRRGLELIVDDKLSDALNSNKEQGENQRRLSAMQEFLIFNFFQAP